MEVEGGVPHGHGTAAVRAHPPGINIMVHSGRFRLAAPCEIQYRATLI
jgi:hypothetical protein